MPRRRLLLLAALTALIATATAVLPAVADARAGSGSSSFGGSGGGGFGGGGGGGSGKGFALFLIFRVLLDIAVLGHGLGALFVVALLIGAYLYYSGGRKVADWWEAQRRRGRAQSRKAARRQRAVELAAAEAADNDSSFDPDNVRAQAEKLFLDVQTAWGASDRVALNHLVAPRLMGEWERRLDDLDRRGYTNNIEIKGTPKVEFVGIARGAGTALNGGPDRVIVRIQARIRDWVTDRQGREINERGELSKTIRMREYWTLQRHNDTWWLESIEQGAEGSHQLEAQMTQTEWADTQALQDQAVVEQASQHTVENIAEYAPVSFEGDGERAALDLSLVDGRFAPDVLSVAARRVTAAWAQAVDGSIDELRTVTTAGALRQMLNPAGDNTRLVVRGPQVERIDIVDLDAHGITPTMTLDVKLSGYRYLQDRATDALVAGSDTRRVSFTERWTLALSPDEKNPWRVVAAQTPAAR